MQNTIQIWFTVERDRVTTVIPRERKVDEWSESMAIIPGSNLNISRKTESAPRLGMALTSGVDIKQLRKTDSAQELVTSWHGIFT
jgi:hypothetical protein